MNNPEQEYGVDGLPIPSWEEFDEIYPLPYFDPARPLWDEDEER